jgi:hypothetical protein
MQYIEDLFVEIGLEPGGADDTYRQTFDYDTWNLTSCPTVTFDGNDLEMSTDYGVFYYSGGGEVDAEVVFAGYATTVPPFDPEEYPYCPFDPDTGYDDFADVDVTDKIALVLRRYPANDESIAENCPANEACNSTPCIGYFGYKAANAAYDGAAGMMLVQDYSNSADLIEGGTLNPEYFDAEFPALFLHRGLVEAAIPDLPAWADAIDANLTPDSHATGVNATISMQGEAQTIYTDNILGVIPGTDPDIGHEVVLVGAHLDHVGTELCSDGVFNGADDNASGTASVIELARALAGCGAPPARTVIFAAWNAEEQGLLGSIYYTQHPTMPLTDFVAVLNLDMVGAGNGTGLDIYNGIAANSSWIVTLMRNTMAEQGLDYEIAAHANTGGSDHAPFVDRGVPASHAWTMGMHGAYHTTNDTIDTISVEDLAVANRIHWGALVPLAMGTEDEYLEDKGTPAPAPAAKPAFDPAPAALDGPR